LRLATFAAVCRATSFVLCVDVMMIRFRRADNAWPQSSSDNASPVLDLSVFCQILERCTSMAYRNPSKIGLA
jgi:hypothetical protein